LEASTSSKTLVHSVEEVRRLLQPALFQLQEREKFTVGSVRVQLMETSGNLAEIIGSLYQAGRVDEDDNPDVSSTVAKAYAKLERILQNMGDLPGTENERRDVAHALALLFALGAGPRSSCPPPRRSSTSMRAVRVPEAPQKSKTAISSPSIELGEIDAAALGLDLDAPPSSRRSAQASDESLSPADDVPASERRTSPRIGFEVDVGFVSESNFYAGLSMDVSDGGLFVATYQLQPVGSDVAVTFVLPSGYAITTNAVVRWVREESDDASPGMGLAFELTGEDRRQVCAFCDRRQPLFIDMD
jgi:uncharacterized protein (TIGR02266 family)